MSAPTKTKILVIGGGSAGLLTAQALSKALDPRSVSIQLVTERTFYIWWPAMVRVLVTGEGSLEKQALLPYDKAFIPGKAGEVVIGKVKSIEGDSVFLSDGRQLAYDYLVLATGTQWSGPLALPDDIGEAEKWISNWRGKFARARNIVVVGAGAVGFELGGELRHFYPNKTVTVVHSQVYPLNGRYPDKFRKHALEKARAFGVNFVVGDRLTPPKGPFTSVTTEKGLEIQADLVVTAVGGKPNTDFLHSLDPSIVTSSGTVRVQNDLRVPLANGKRNVYALGDIIEWDEEKQLAKVPSHVAVVSTNIINAIKGSSAKPKEYKGSMEGLGMPLGPNGGVGYVSLLGGITMGDFVMRMLKSKTLMLDAAKKTLTQA